MSDCCETKNDAPNFRGEKFLLPGRGEIKIAPLCRPKDFTLALIGNPNAGKTTLFNVLTGLRARTANFPGTTVEKKIGNLKINGGQINIVDLPGLYSLDGGSPEEKIASDALRGIGMAAPDAALVVVDATNL